MIVVIVNDDFMVNDPNAEGQCCLSTLDEAELADSAEAGCLSTRARLQGESSFHPGF